MKAEVVTQLGIVIPNEPGAIAKICDHFLQNKINILSFMFSDTAAQGVVRFVVDKATEAKKSLEEAGYFVVSAEVVVVDVEDKPGSLLEITKALGEAGVNIDYAYASDDPDGKFTRDTLKLSDTKKGLEVIKQL